MPKKPRNFSEEVVFLAEVLRGFQYAFRGTASLVLQGLEMNVDDIDILCDKDTALACNDLLKDYPPSQKTRRIGGMNAKNFCFGGFQLRRSKRRRYHGHQPVELHLVEKVVLRESDKFKSYFGKFNLQGIPVEVMGEWQIKDNRGNWGIPLNALERQKIILDSQEIYVTTLESELSAFAKMGRWTAYQKILREIKETQKNQQKLF